MAEKSFEVVDSPSKMMKIIIPAAAAVVVLAGVLIFALSGSKEEPAQAAQPAQPAQAQAQAAQPVPASQPEVRVVAKNPAQQAELDQQLQRLLYYVANPTMDDANTTIQFLAQKFNQPPEVIIPDLFVLIRDLQALSDENLAVFFRGEQNPWNDDQGYNAIINFISHRQYLDFVNKCATLYQTQTQTQSQTRTGDRTPG